MANCESGPPGARALYQRQVDGVSSSARSLEKFASMNATRPSSPASIASRIVLMPPISRALWPTVTVTSWRRSSASISRPSSSVLGIGQCGLEVGRGRHARLLRKRRALLLGAAVAGDDRKLVGFLARAREHLGPAAEP